LIFFIPLHLKKVCSSVERIVLRGLLKIQIIYKLYVLIDKQNIKSGITACLILLITCSELLGLNGDVASSISPFIGDIQYYYGIDFR